MTRRTIVVAGTLTAIAIRQILLPLANITVWLSAVVTDTTGGTGTARRWARRVLRVGLGVAFIACLGSSEAGAEQRTFLPVADATVRQTNPTTNYGSATTLVVGDESYNELISYLRFDLSSLAGVTITSVKLRLYCSAARGGSVWPEVRRVSASWTEGGLTYNNMPDYTGDYLSDGSATAGTWYEVLSTADGPNELRPLVQGWLNNSIPNYGILIRQDPYFNADRTFNSREAASYKPELVVEFVTPPSAGTVWGYVVRTGTTYGIAGATVSVQGTSLTATTGSDGKYTIANVPAGAATLNATRTGFATGTQGVTVPAGGTVQASNITESSQIVLDVAGSSITPPTGVAGQAATLTLRYRITNSGAATATVWLGADLYPPPYTAALTDPAHDLAVNVAPGTAVYTRTFDVPAASATGSYDWTLGLWGTREAAGSFATSFDLQNKAAAWEVSPQPSVTLSVYRISDTSGTPNTAAPGVARTVFNQGETIRVTLMGSNTGNAVPVQTVLNLLPTGSALPSYDSNDAGQNSSADSPLAMNEVDYYSFDWTVPSSATVGTYDLLASIRDQYTFGTVYDDTEPGANTTTVGSSARVRNQFTVTVPRTIFVGIPGGDVFEDCQIPTTRYDYDPRIAYASMDGNDIGWIAGVAWSFNGVDAIGLRIATLRPNSVTHIFSPGRVSEVAQFVQNTYRPGDRVVLAGHSDGAGDAQEVAINLPGIPFALLGLVDSVNICSFTGPDIPANVAAVKVFYQTEGLVRGRSDFRATGTDTTISKTLINSPVGPANPSTDPNAQHRNMDNDRRTWEPIMNYAVNMTPGPGQPAPTTATNVLSSQFTANWSAGSDATGYRLDVSTSNTFESFVEGYHALDVGDVSSKAVTGLLANTPYYYRVLGYNGNGTSGYSSSISTATLVTPKASGDVDGDGKADVLWHHATSGQVWLWPMDGPTRGGQLPVDTVSDTNWEIRGVADFNGDGEADIVWRNKLSGSVYVWLMDGSSHLQPPTYVGSAPTDYDIVCTSDYDGDGKADILWRHSTNGQVWIWLMNGATLLTPVLVDTVDPAYAIVGSGDLNADAKADIVWRHTTSGAVWVWLMNGTSRTSQTYVATVADLGYRVVGVADFDGNGKADILWHHATNGQVWIWPMDGATLLSQSYVDTVPDTGYQVVATGDYDGDGKADILWHHATQGAVWVWLMNGTTRLSQTWVGTVPDVGYQIVKTK